MGMMKFVSGAFLVVTLVALGESIPFKKPGSMGNWKRPESMGNWKRPEIEMGAYSWEVEQDEGDAVRQIVTIFDKEVLAISTLKDGRWPPSSETIVNETSKLAVLIPELWGPCYLTKFEDDVPIRENMEQWDDQVISFTNTIELDGTSEKMPQEEIQELLKDEPMMMMRCMWKGVINTSPMEGDGEVQG